MQFWYRCCLACGILTPILDFAVMESLAATQPDYHWMRDFASELGETGRPTAGIMAVWWASFTLCLLPFVWAVRRVPFLSWRLSALLAVYAFCGGLLNGVFPCDPGCRGETLSAKLHHAVSFIGVGTMLVTPLVLRHELGQQRRWPRLRQYSLIAVLGIIAMGIATLIGWSNIGSVSEALRSMFGLLQRVQLAFFYSWLLTLAVRLWPMGWTREP